MTNNDYARIALGAIVGGIAAVAITKTGLSAQSGVLRWIAYCVVAGVAINSQGGMPFRGLLLGGVASALGLLAALCWMLLLGHGTLPAISGLQGVNLFNAPGFAATVLATLFVISTLAVMVCALARPAIIELLQQLDSIDLKKAKKLEGLLKIVVSIAGIIALFVL